MKTIYRHKIHFGDQTDHLEVEGEEIILVRKDGTKTTALLWTKEECDWYVNNGFWTKEEINLMKPIFILIGVQFNDDGHYDGLDTYGCYLDYESALEQKKKLVANGKDDYKEFLIRESSINE